MRLLLIGATGTIGAAVAAALRERHDVVAVTRHSAPWQVDIASMASIRALFDAAGPVDGVIGAAGAARFKPLAQLDDDDFAFCLQNKLMGQVNLVLIGQHYISPGGSFTLTGGSLGEDPVVAGASLSAVNAAIDGFVRGAAIELKNGVRINSVGPDVVEESPHYFPFFPGHIPVSMHKVTQAYLKSVLGAHTGKCYKVVE